MPDDTAAELEALLQYLKRERGFDFTGYKRPSIERRIGKRLQAVGVDSFTEYMPYLEANPDEVAVLFDTILINVTTFFRDGGPWEFLAAEVVPRILEQKGQDEPIRVWSAGCATGEEAYTLAMTFAESLGLEAFRERVKIYATDVDETALGRARLGAYPAREVTGVPAPMREKYFERVDSQYTVRKDLRRGVIFGRNDLVHDAPISRIDLLVCRNTLMYFNAASQRRVLARFHFAVNEGGFLLLGRAETLFTQGNIFVPVDLKRRVFMKATRGAPRGRALGLAPAPEPAAVSPSAVTTQLRDAAFEGNPVAQLVLDRSGAVTLANERARVLFGLGVQDLGRPFQDLEMSYRPLELRTPIEQAYDERRPVTVREVRWPGPNGGERWFDAQLLPVAEPGGPAVGMSITFIEVTTTKELQREIEHSHQELETAYEELQSTNEELETTNEELQSTVEELETTNEELQSTNEELETMNEELQSTNEELQTINDELRRRSEELNQLNDFLASVFTSLRGGVAVLDRDLVVLVWSRKAEDLWGLRADEVQGTHFLNLDIGLPVQELRTPVRACLSGECESTELVLAATNRRGKAIGCRVSCTPLLGDGREPPRGVILLMEETAGIQMVREE